MSRAHWVVNRADGPVRSIAREDAAYLAGLIDGEGTISVYARHKITGNLSHSLNEHVSVVNTNRAIIEHVQHLLGTGTIYGRDRGLGNRTCYVLPFDGQRAVAVIQQIEPFLIGKRRQAGLALAIAGLREERRTANWVDYDDNDLIQLSAWVNEIAVLNGGKRVDVQVTRVRDVKIKAVKSFKMCEVEGCQKRATRPSWEYCPEHWAWIVEELYRRQCAHCGQEFAAQTLEQQFCSAKCQWQASRMRREGKGQSRTFSCPECGKEVTTTDARKLTCDARCYSRWQYKRRKESGYFEARKEK